ncbi:regulatory protein FlaEY [alpha proteobacterium U9-1i]|nr:regulatory protein FlaEY [alpha proteobacterium U9-1i]
MVTLNSALLSALYSGTDTSGISADLLTSLANARARVGLDTSAAGQDRNAPLAPVWQPGLTPAASVLVDRATTGKAFFDTGAKLYSDLGATGDYKRLFALHSGLSTLSALTSKAGEEGLSKAALAQVNASFARGLAELKEFFGAQQFEDIRLAQGDRVDEAQTTLALPSRSEDYTTPFMHRGGLYDKVAGLPNDATFEIVATSAGGTVRNVTIDLAEMGSMTRSFGNVISFINGKLSAAGASSRLEAVDVTPKTQTIVIAGEKKETKYVGPKQYALKVDIRANERVAFNPIESEPGFYAVGTTASGQTRLIKLSDVMGEGGQPVWQTRPDMTADPIGALVSTGWLGPGAPYGAAPAGAYEQKTNALMGVGDNNSFEKNLRAAGEAVLKLDFPDGRVLSVTTGWRGGDQEAWRTRAGESGDRAIMDDLAERLTQLLHEQGVAAGVEVWEDGDNNLGLSVMTGDGVVASSLSIGGKAVSFEQIDPAGMVGGLRDGVFARRFEAAGVAGAGDLFVGKQSFTVTTQASAQTITIDGGEDGIDAATLVTKLNAELRKKNIGAAAELVNNAGVLSLRFDALHSVVDVTSNINEDSFDLDRLAPGAWVSGGLPTASAGQPFGDAIRSVTLSGSPLSTYTGALDIAIDVATPTGTKTVSVSISALERANDPDPAPGEWSASFKARLDEALNAAGVYVSAEGADLSEWRVAEGAGQRIAAIRINGDTQTLSGAAPSGGVGGAFAPERSFTSAGAATAIDDEVSALVSDPNVSVTFNTVWGARTVSANLEPGDPRTLESAALRLNEALAAAGYDVGVAATALSGGGAGLRVLTGSSHTVRGVSGVNIGGANHATTLDPIDSASSADDPVGALRVAARASRGAAVTEVHPGGSTFTAPSVNASAWFPGRAWDVSVGGSAKVATGRSVATGADGSVFVLADLDGDSATTPIKGARDVALMKYDSAGKLEYTRILGASGSANGMALAVSADGKVAVAGSVEGGLSGTTAKGGADSFVTLYDAKGDEVWTQRRGATSSDQVNAVSFASNGAVIVAGQTESALGSQISLGGVDGYVRGYSAGGAELFTRQFGTGGADKATALLVRDDGVGGFDIYTGGVENDRGVLRRFNYSSGAGFVAGASRDIGHFHKGALNTLAYDNGALYVGGEVTGERVNVGAVARGAVAGQEGFVARLDAGLVSTMQDRTTYLGSAQDDTVRSVNVVGGVVYASGNAGGVMAGQGVANARAAFLTRLDADGDIAWSRTFNSAAGTLSLNGFAVDTSGASALDVLSLPRGVVAASDTNALAQRSALRVGDEFSIGIDGRRMTNIKIGEKDTLSSLVAQINRAIGAGGRATIVKEEGVERLKILASDGRAIRVEAGRSGRDALAGLGLGPGVIAKNATGRDSVRTFGLGLVEADLKIGTKAEQAKARAEISAAISIVRIAYDTLLNPNAQEQTPEQQRLAARRAAAGAAPEYYTQQLANYQAALTRLGG